MFTEKRITMWMTVLHSGQLEPMSATVESGHEHALMRDSFIKLHALSLVRRIWMLPKSRLVLQIQLSRHYVIALQKRLNS